MKRSLRVICLASLTLLITGCGDKPKPEPEDKLINAQREALEAAKEVEGILQSAEEERRKKVDN